MSQKPQSKIYAESGEDERLWSKGKKEELIKELTER